MIQLLPEPKMAEDFKKTTININDIYFCGEISDELRELAQERFWNYQDIKINETCPPIWYGVASYAVGGPETGTIQVDVDVYEQYIYCILKSMLYGGNKNIYCVAHHQTEEAGLMPMTIACHKAAKKLIMEYMEDTRGRGWWGSNDYADYYENLGSGDDPFSYIKVIPLISKEAQHKCGGFDHAGKYETSLLYALYPDHVDLERTKDNTEWFAESAKEASMELGQHMVKCTLEALKEIIV